MNNMQAIFNFVDEPKESEESPIIDIKYFNNQAVNSIESAIKKRYREMMTGKIPDLDKADILVPFFKCNDINNGLNLYENRNISQWNPNTVYTFDVKVSLDFSRGFGGRRRSRKSRKNRKSRKSRR
jgi:hypothetical protein